MFKLSMTKVAVVLGGLGLSVTAGAGVASAAPDMGPAINTTCTYPQLMSALNAANPAVAAVVNNSPAMTASFNQFLAAPPAERQRMAEIVANDPANAPYLGLYQQVFSTCNNF